MNFLVVLDGVYGAVTINVHDSWCGHGACEQGGAYRPTSPTRGGMSTADPSSMGRTHDAEAGGLHSATGS